MKVLLSIFFAAAFSVSNAQNLDIPQKEFTVSLSEEIITVPRGESKKLDVRILKSTAFKKNQMKMGLSSSLPSGITVSFDPEKGKTDVARATISANSDATPGKYSIIVNSTINYKTKGSILKIVIQ